MFTHDIGGIHESSNKQDEPHVTDHEHERAAKGYSWGDREVEHGVRSPPFLCFSFVHLQRDLMGCLNVRTWKKEQLEDRVKRSRSLNEVKETREK